MKDTASFLRGGNGNGAAVARLCNRRQQFGLGSAVTHDAYGGILAEIKRGGFEHVFRTREPDLSLRYVHLFLGLPIVVLRPCWERFMELAVYVVPGVQREFGLGDVVFAAAMPALLHLLYLHDTDGAEVGSHLPV